MPSLDNLENTDILCGNCLDLIEDLPYKHYQTCISEPTIYHSEKTDIDGFIGNEDNIEGYISNVVKSFRRVKRVLRDQGTLWVILHDLFATSSKWKELIVSKNKKFQSKELIGMPWRIALALQEDGWLLRNDIIWEKPNCTVTSVQDRCTISHSYIFLFVKQEKYFYNKEAILEPLKSLPHAPKNKKYKEKGIDDPNRVWGSAQGRNRRTVWTYNIESYEEDYNLPSVDMIENCVLAGSRENDAVLDIFNGKGTTAIAALRNDRQYTGIEIKEDNIRQSIDRIDLIPSGKMKDLF